MPSDIYQTPAGRFFWLVTAWPKAVITAGILAVIAAGIWIPSLRRDASAEAFIPRDDPAVLYRQKVKAIFGLSDPVVVLLVNDRPTGIFNPHSLELLDWLTQRIADLPSVNPQRVTSLATENNTIGTEEGILVSPFFDPPPATQAEADRVRDAVMAFDLYVGNLVSPAGDATLISAELFDEADGAAVYRQVLDLVAKAPAEHERIHVAGEGAVTAHLGDYIDADMWRLNLLCGLVITILLFLSYRTVRGVFLPWFVVAAAAAAAIGSMAAAGVPFFVITNALPVILIAIGVADGVHILGRYYEHGAMRPDAPQRERVIRTMVDMWRPITVTSLTDIGGFLGIYAATVMPPMKAFGMFTVVGTAAALLMSLLVIPACLMLLRPGSSSAFREPQDVAARPMVDWYGRAMAGLGRLVTRRAGVVVAIAGLVLIAGVVGASRLVADEERIANFKQSEPIYLATALINEKMNGTNYLDVVVETSEREGLFQPEHLERIEALQNYLTSLPHVKGAVSFLDYLKQMNRAVNENQRAAYHLPETEELVAQYFLLYSATGDPTDFNFLVNYDYRLANIRVAMDSGLYTDGKIVIEAAERYIAENFNAPGVTAHLAGRINVDYHWIGQLLGSHFRSVLVALAAVWLVLAISFRSVIAGVFALAPVAMAVLLIYALMGFAGVWLSLGTSMFAAIAIGTGVDFAVHTLDHLIVLVKKEGRDLEEAFAMLYPSTGRALVFNFSAVLLGFGLMMTSYAPPLIRFGALVTVSVAVSFLASMTVLPALIILLKPAFVGCKPHRLPKSAGWKPAMLLLGIPLCGLPLPARADETTILNGEEIAKRVNDRDDGDFVARTLIIELIDKNEKKRRRVTNAFRKDEKGARHTAIFYVEPKNVKGTAFLNIDYVERGRADDRWLYLPATRKVRRISAADRGDYFLGTDLTYEDIANETKVNIEDYTRRARGSELVDGHPCLIMEATPIDDKVAGELGYSRVISWIDPELWMLRKADYWDTRGRHLKTVNFRQIKKVQGTWTAHRLEVHNHRSGHTTILMSQGVDYQGPVDHDLFTVQALKRGPR